VTRDGTRVDPQGEGAAKGEQVRADTRRRGGERGRGVGPGALGRTYRDR
jgi:hypothetical protein